MNTLHFYRQNNTKRNILSNAAYFTSNVKDAEYKCVNYNLHENNYLQRSISADNVVIRSRGFKPSDRHDPAKRNFLENLSSKILHFDMEGGEVQRIDLQKLLTPASDSNELLQAKKDQVELARRISHSLSDVRNMKSKGQSMYVNRKKRSVKWIHDGNGVEDEEEPCSPAYKDKIPLKCMMNPSGKVLDIHGIQALGEEVNIETMPSHPEKTFDIVRDLNNQKGRGAEIFAKRRKRSEKWVVDMEQIPSQIPSTPGCPKIPNYPNKQGLGLKENAKLPIIESLLPFAPFAPSPVIPAPTLESKPFYNPFTLDLSLESENPPATENDFLHFAKRVDYCATETNEIKKIQMKEVAVGTDIDFPIETQRPNAVEKSKRISFDILDKECSQSVLQYKQSNKSIPGDNINQLASYNGNHKQCDQSDSEDSEYTPIPVKQLIKEFEKTCRPAMQFKQLSPRLMIQHCPLDNDISRYFKGQTPAKYEEPSHKIVQSNRLVNETGHYNCSAPMKEAKNYYHQENAKLYDEIYFDEDDVFYKEDPRLFYDNAISPNKIHSQYQHEIASEFNGNRPMSLKEIGDYYQQQAPSQFYENGKIGNSHMNGNIKFLNTEAEVPLDAKSLALALVASEEDILETIKHLRRTPVLDNLMQNASPDCKFSDFYPKVGKLTCMRYSMNIT